MPRTRSIAWSQVKLGVLGVVALLLVAVTVAAVGGEAGFFWQLYPIKMQFSDVQGLKSGAVVRLSGKDVGRVESVEFAGEVIEVTCQISRDVRALITDRSVATVGALSLLGESFVTVKAAPGGRPVEDWGYVRTAEATSMANLTETATAGLADAQKLIADVRAGRGTIGKLVTDDALYNELNAFIASAGDVTRNINQGKGTMGRLMNDPAAYESLRGSLANLEQMTARINSGQGALGRFLNDEAMARSLSATMTNLETTTSRLNKGEGTMGKLLTDKELYDRLNQMTGRIDDVVRGLNSGEGTAGQLLRDKQLYDNMNRAVTELKDLIADIRKDPKKFLRVSVSIF
jgi:phospholipid/cholesterol/gamma-HCH transport system substrate-binding protein